MPPELPTQPPPPILISGRCFEWGRRSYVMGIVNVTPDSFSGDGVLDPAAAAHQAARMVEDGADLIDVGAESTRPDHEPLDAAGEWARLAPVLRAVRDAVDAPISVDTSKASVAERAFDAGADALNDVHGLRADAALASLLAARGLPAVLMHNQRGRSSSGDVIADVCAGLEESLAIAEAAGVRRELLILDPGFGFGIGPQQSLELVRRLGELRCFGRPLLLGSSRKSAMPLEWPADGWTYGTPDVIVASPEGIVEPDAADWFGEWGETSTGLTADRYIKAVEVKEVRVEEGPQIEADDTGRADLSLFVVHHAVITSDAPENVVEPLDCGNETSCGGHSGQLRLTYELGQNPTIFPDEMGVKLPAGSVLTFNSMHLHSIGREVRARVDVGLTLHPEGYEPRYVQSNNGFRGANMYDYEFDVPSNDDNVMRDGFHRITRPTKMLMFEPHLHSSGKRMCVEALYPNNVREMLSCSNYDHNWVKVYVYEDDVAPLLPAGTVIHVMAWYDNSPTNRNVVDPRNWKGWGNRSIDDMFVSITRTIEMTEEEFQAEVAARGGRPLFAASQDQQ